jgi:nitrite reductase (NADH) large subunit
MAEATWRCEVCGYVHTGDAPPAECPVCGVDGGHFSPFQAVQVAAPAAPAVRAWRCSICEHVAAGAEPPGTCPVCGAGAALFEPQAEQDQARAARPPGRIVILGGGIAAVTAAEHARTLAPESEIRLVERDTALPYHRLNLTRFLADEVPEATLPLHAEGWYTAQRIQRVHGEADSLDLAAQKVRLRGGEALAFDRLLLATGAHAFVPPLGGARRAGVHVLRSLTDARALREEARPGARVVCIGGGLLGLETAGALARLGLEATVLEGFGWLLPRQLPERAGRLLAARLQATGLGVRCGVRVEELGGDERVREVRLQGGESLPADLVVISAGVRPNSHLARQAGLAVATGVSVDDHLVSSHPAVLAAGDVAEHRGLVYGLWPAAWAQGAVAGAVAAGGDASFSGLAPSNRIKVLDVDLFSIGQVSPGDASFQLMDEERDGIFSRLVARDGRLVGAALYGDTRAAGMLKAAIESGAPLQTLTALQEHFPALACAAAAC